MTERKGYLERKEDHRHFQNAVQSCASCDSITLLVIAASSGLLMSASTREREFPENRAVSVLKRIEHSFSEIRTQIKSWYHIMVSLL